MRILIVEDQLNVANYVKRALEEQGYAVDVAHTGRDALDWAAVVDFDLMVLDIMVPDVADTLRPLAEEKGLKLDCTTPENLVLRGDIDGLIRLFVNLLGNAIKYTEQGQITVTAVRRADDALKITIADTGIGIAPEHLPHLFDRFYRVDKARSPDGAGLGLAIAMNVAQAHHGTITVQSRVGQGTTFTVQLAAKPLVEGSQIPVRR